MARLAQEPLLTPLSPIECLSAVGRRWKIENALRAKAIFRRFEVERDAALVSVERKETRGVGRDGRWRVSRLTSWSIWKLSGQF